MIQTLELMQKSAPEKVQEIVSKAEVRKLKNNTPYFIIYEED